MPSATLKIFLVHGDAKRLRTAELSNWTGKAAAAPRSELDDLLARDEALNSGVYFLTGSDPETGKNAVYIGEAESIRERIKGHLDKDYWNHVIFFISKDENLTKAHVRYLEGRLIDQARQAGRALVKNGQGSGARLPESDREDMEIFLEKVHQLLPALGADFLLPHVSQFVERMGRQALYCEIKGHRAMGAVSSTMASWCSRVPGRHRNYGHRLTSIRGSSIRVSACWTKAPSLPREMSWFLSRIRNSPAQVRLRR